MPGAEHFSPQFNLYHGSYADLKPGDHVHLDNDDVFATDNAQYASEYGDVHKVEPVDPSDLIHFYDDAAVDEETGEPFYTKYASKAGFRVVK